MRKISEKKKKLFFIIPNILISVVLMIFYFVKRDTGFPYSLIPSYFFGVLAAIFSMYYIHPKVKEGKNQSKFLRIYSIIILILTIIIAISILIFKLWY